MADEVKIPTVTELKLPSTQMKEGEGKEPLPKNDNLSAKEDNSSSDETQVVDKRRAHDDQRWQKLTAKLRESDAKAAKIQQDFEEYKKSNAPAEKPKEWETIGDFQKDIIENARREAIQAIKDENSQSQAAIQKNAKFNERFTEYSKTKPDLQAKILETFSEVSGELGSIVSDIARHSKVGPQLLDHLTSNPELLAELDSLPDDVRRDEIKFLEYKLRDKSESVPAEADGEHEEAPVVDKKPAIPAPMSKTKGTKSGKTKTVEDMVSDQNLDAYMAFKKSQRKK